MAGTIAVRVVDVDSSLADTFLSYARTFGAAHDDSYVSPEDLAGFDLAAEPAVLALDGGGAPVGAASVMLDGYEREGLSRFRVLHATNPSAYAPMLAALVARLRGRVERTFLFLPEDPGALAEVLPTAGFAESRRAYIMLHPSPSAVMEPELPGETVLEKALPTAATQWANVINAAFRGQPGRYDMTPERAAELLSRDRIIRDGTLLACRGGRPAGVVLTISDAESPYTAEIETLAVMPADQHIGLGRAMLRAAIRAAGSDGRSSVSLSVSTFNKRALALYIDAGFGVQDVRVCWECQLAAAPA